MNAPCRSFLTTLALAASASLASASVPITPVPPQATLRTATVQVRVAPDHRDWTYQLGEPARFKVTVAADNEPIDSVTVSYQVGPEMMPAPTTAAAVPLDGLVIDGGTMAQPGFLRCVVTTEVGGARIAGRAPPRTRRRRSSPRRSNRRISTSSGRRAKPRSPRFPSRRASPCYPTPVRTRSMCIT